jgi:hypothetical protein
LLLTGCLDGRFNGDRHDVVGEKIEPGRCRQPGIVEISMAFHAPPNATLAVEYHSMRAITGFSTIVYLGGGRVLDKGAARWETERSNDWVAAGENGTIIHELPSVPESAWSAIDFEYYYDENGRAVPTRLHCSLEGDNAPWAFEVKS